MRTGWISVAADLLLGAQCPGCSRAAYGICDFCAGAASAYGGYLTRPDPCPRGFPLTATTSPYDLLMKRLIREHKEHQLLLLTPFLAARLATAVEQLLAVASPRPSPAAIVLVPVPSTPAAVRRRGLDATWAMARRAARLCRADVPVTAGRMLATTRRVQDQAGLTATARAQNLAGSLRMRRTGWPPGAAVVIVDDVVTTGSSLTEAARVLRAAPVVVLGAATVAATVRSATSPQTRRGAGHDD